MSEDKTTPGPWLDVYPGDGYTLWIDKPDGSSDYATDADVTLMKAAPDLLTALKETVDDLEMLRAPYIQPPESLSAAYAAIKRAEGGDER